MKNLAALGETPKLQIYPSRAEGVNTLRGDLFHCILPGLIETLPVLAKYQIVKGNSGTPGAYRSAFQCSFERYSSGRLLALQSP